MSEPELWTRCPDKCYGGMDAKSYTGTTNPYTCGRCGGKGLVEVPFDEAVQRMADYVDRHNDAGELYGLVGLLRAALGEEP